MQTIDALFFALDVYVLTLIVAVFVGVVIIVIRRITADPAPGIPTVGQRARREDLEP